MSITIRPFAEEDIPAKVKWVNDERNNTYLHYELPLREDKTLSWFKSIQGRTDRYDAVIEADGVPCGLIGLLDIDRKNKKAEYYVMLGDPDCRGKGIAVEASRLLLDYAFTSLELNKVYLYTEIENNPAQKLFQKLGFVKEGIAREDLFSKERYVDRLMYGMLQKEHDMKISGGGVQASTVLLRFCLLSEQWKGRKA